VLAAAKEEAQHILTRTQAEAEERLRRLKEELAALQVQAETRRGDAQADTEVVWKERHELLEDIRGVAAALVDLTTLRRRVFNARPHRAARTIAEA
jgi:hypothetical protein